MAENTLIEWATMTFNPWRGCRKIAPGCKNCYAEKLVNGRMQGDFANKRIRLADAGWYEPVRWNRKAACNCNWPAGQHSVVCPQFGANRPRVFCASLADVFEDWQGDVHDPNGKRLWVSRCIGANDRPRYFIETPQGDFSQCRPARLDDLRRDLFALIDATPNLDWLLLTKRPENVRRMWPINPHSPTGQPGHRELMFYRPNCWLLTSVSDQPTADAAIPHLLACRDLVPVLGVSYEPALGPVDFGPWMCEETPAGYRILSRFYTPKADEFDPSGKQPERTLKLRKPQPLDWIIFGGESGPHARPCDIAWARSTVEQCRAAGVACFVKQLGAQPYDSECWSMGSFDGSCGHELGMETGRHGLALEDKKGGDIAEWPEDLAVRQFPKQNSEVPIAK